MMDDNKAMSLDVNSNEHLLRFRCRYSSSSSCCNRTKEYGTFVRTIWQCYVLTVILISCRTTVVDAMIYIPRNNTENIVVDDTGTDILGEVVNVMAYDTLPALFGSYLTDGKTILSRIQYLTENQHLCSVEPHYTYVRSLSNSSNTTISTTASDSIDSLFTPMSNSVHPAPTTLLVSAGKCPFDIKVKNAQKLDQNIKFLIVYNDDREDFNTIVPMDTTSTDEDVRNTTIVLNSVSYRTGRIIRDYIEEQIKLFPLVSAAGGPFIQLDSEFDDDLLSTSPSSIGGGINVSNTTPSENTPFVTGSSSTVPAADNAAHSNGTYQSYHERRKLNSAFSIGLLVFFGTVLITIIAVMNYQKRRRILFQEHMFREAQRIQDIEVAELKYLPPPALTLEDIELLQRYQLSELARKDDVEQPNDANDDIVLAEVLPSPKSADTTCCEESNGLVAVTDTNNSNHIKRMKSNSTLHSILDTIRDSDGSKHDKMLRTGSGIVRSVSINIDDITIRSTTLDDDLENACSICLDELTGINPLDILYLPCGSFKRESDCAGSVEGQHRQQQQQQQQQALEGDQQQCERTINHKFHFHCVLPWLLERQGSCPLCKFDVKEYVQTLKRKERLSKQSASTTSTLDSTVAITSNTTVNQTPTGADEDEELGRNTVASVPPMATLELSPESAVGYFHRKRWS